MEKNGKIGFTLAEVLIALSIIGVVAALTIPPLVRKYEKQQWIIGYKTTYNILHQATMLVAANNDGSLNQLYDPNDIGYMHKVYTPYLKITINCENENITGKCFPLKYKFLNNQEATFSTAPHYAMVLSNGASVRFQGVSAYIDTNGLKGPNVWGKDIHQLEIFINDAWFSPYGGKLTDGMIRSNCPDNLRSASGITCGMRILRGDYGTAY